MCVNENVLWKKNNPKGRLDKTSYYDTQLGFIFRRLLAAVVI